MIFAGSRRVIVLIPHGLLPPKPSTSSKARYAKPAAVLNTDVRTLFIPGRQIDDAFLNEMEESFIQSDMGVKNVETMVAEVRERWRLGKIKNAEDAKNVVKEQMVAGWGPPETRELRYAESGADGDSRRRN